VRYRALESAPLSGPHGLRLAALTPQHPIDAASRSSLLRLASALAAALLLLAAATYLLGRSIASNLGRLAAAAQGLAQGRLDQRVDVRGRDEFARLGTAFNQMAEQLQVRLDELELARARTRAANARFGATLAATLDPAELLRTVAAAAVEATDAAGGVVVRPGEEPATAGDPDPQGQRIVFPLRAGEADFGSLVLTGPGFTEEHIETVAALASQAVVALENARLHRIVQGQALKDGLTGLANRRSVEETLHAEIARAQRFGDTVCLVLADLDDFKSVNDRHGHPAGDDALRLFAETLAGTVREIDVAARWGGEEFALVLPGTDAAGGARLAERARETLESRPLITDGETVTLTASFGVAALPPAHDLEELVAAADAALYEAKRTGKNRGMV
jgi:diguanylate cyclase (GGDEF)-like protein